jgi:hypothetical protein
MQLCPFNKGGYGGFAVAFAVFSSRAKAPPLKCFDPPFGGWLLTAEWRVIPLQ